MGKLRKRKLDPSLYYNAARLITELVTLEDEKREVRYLSTFAEPPTVADQIAGVLCIGMALTNLSRRKNRQVESGRIIDLLLWHDAPETRYGDIARWQKRNILINEEKTRSELFGSVPWGLEIIELIEDFEEREDDINIKIAKDADALYVVYTIKDILEKGFLVNQPEVRIKRTLDRLLTQEGFNLGKEMSEKRTSDIWKLIRRYGQINGERSHPHYSLWIILVTIWILVELRKKEGKKEVERDKILESIVKNDKPKGKIASSLIKDSEKIYNLIKSKRSLLGKKNKTKKKRFSIKSIKTPEARKLAETVKEIDLYEWWNLMMGYLTLNPDGSLEEKMR